LRERSRSRHWLHGKVSHSEAMRHLLELGLKAPNRKGTAK
jgi:hypothetical protein